MSKNNDSADTRYLFSYFINNGEDGLHLAYSTDGLVWTALKQGRSFLTPTVGESKLMRDPCILRGPDNIFRMVWTTAWWGKTIGYAWSSDLIVWHNQQAIPVMDEANNCWAPEIYYDASSKDYIIFWSSTVEGQFTETAAAGEANHRTYYTTTTDFINYAPSKLFFDPGFNCIDPTMVKHNNEYYLIFKDERDQPAQKNLRIAKGPTPRGPWGADSEPFSPQPVEGPSCLKIGDAYYVYYDHFMENKYGVMRTNDFSAWENLTNRLVMPEGVRHGTALEVAAPVVEALLAAED